MNKLSLSIVLSVLVLISNGQNVLQIEGKNVSLEEFKNIFYKNNNNVDDIENVPAYMRKNMTMDNGVATNESYLSGYSVAPNNAHGPLNPSPIQTINTFLEGDRPD